MDRRGYIKTVLLGSVIPLSSSAFGFTKIDKELFSEPKPVSFKSQWHLWPNMKWVGPQYWGNRLQDWNLKDGQSVCLVKGKNRSLQLMTVQNPYGDAEYFASVTIKGFDNSFTTKEKGYFGFRLGSKGRYNDYRSTAVFGKGLDVGLNTQGDLVIGEKVYKTNLSNIPKEFVLHIEVKKHTNSDQLLQITIKNPSSEKILYTIKEVIVSKELLKGNFALVSHIDVKRNNKYQPVIGFSNWSITSNSLYHNANNIFGPICFAQYSLHRGKLKLTTQLSPVEEIKGHKVLLQFKINGKWVTNKTKTITNTGRAVNFHIENWKHKEYISYRIRLQLPLKKEVYQYDYDGTIALEPIEKDEVKAAVFSCNFDYGFPDADVNEQVSKLNPDICLFLGDQFYEGTGGFGVQYNGDFDKISLDYLRKWMMFGWSYRELFRHKPCVIMPDDHDVYHGNIWGENGKRADVSKGYGGPAQDSGGYKMAAEWVNMAQFTQTSHLPDPVDPTPVLNNIRVYYTHWNYAGISFALLEDRKFKSAPLRILPKEAQVVNGWIMSDDFDIKKYKHLDAELLGERQEKFIEEWVLDWSYGAEMKAVLSQTNFATVATLPKGAKTGAVIPSLPIPEVGEYVRGDVPTVDMDSNGWPSKKRDKAVEIIRKGFAFHIAGDQHLGSFIQYGLDDFEDSGFAFAGPALNNIWPRRFWPPVDSSKHTYNNPAYTGNHIDGFGNKMTVKAIANPHNMNKEPEILHNRAVGYGIVTFNKKKRTISTSCYRRFVDPKEKDAQYPGWPITITQGDNYGKKASGFLPEIKVKGLKNPVIQIINESNQEVEYSLRLNQKTFRAKVFDNTSSYTIKVGDPDSNLWLNKKEIKVTRSKKLKFKFS